MQGVALTCGIPLILIVLGNLQESLSTSSSQKQNQIITFDEKKEAQFLFVTPDNSDNCTFKLSHNGVTFNINGKETFSQKFSYEKQLRTSVHIQSAFGYLGVSISIKNTRARDRGIYQCKFTCNTTTTVQKAKLLIYYPPGPINCHWVDKEKIPLEAATYFNLSVLRCTGQNSYPEADVLCYSNRKDNTLILTPLRITYDRIYSATFWLKRDQDLSCCSVSTRFTKSIQDCDDFHSLRHSTKATESKVDTSTESSHTTVAKADKISASQDAFNTETILSTEQDCKDCIGDLPCSYIKYHIAIVTLTVLCVALTLIIFTTQFEKACQISDSLKKYIHY